MPDVYGGSFANDGAGYDAVVISTTLVSATGGETAVAALIEEQLDHLKALLPDNSPTASNEAIHPDFKDISPHTAQKLRDEIDFLKAAISPG